MLSSNRDITARLLNNNLVQENTLIDQKKLPPITQWETMPTDLKQITGGYTRLDFPQPIEFKNKYFDVNYPPRIVSDEKWKYSVMPWEKIYGNGCDMVDSGLNEPSGCIPIHCTCAPGIDELSEERSCSCCFFGGPAGICMLPFTLTASGLGLFVDCSRAIHRKVENTHEQTICTQIFGSSGPRNQSMT